jgi:protein gp37
MSQKSAIEWTDSTWNPVTGCTKVSPGCKYCYAERLAERWRGVPGHPYEQGFDLRIWADRLIIPLTWKSPRIIFVNSMSDLFHEDVPLSFIRRVFQAMQTAHWHTFQILTKRAERLSDVGPKVRWPPNVWVGVSVEAPQYLWRVERLRSVPAAVRFISFEPLISRIGRVNLRGIHWVIVGGESGPSARPMHPDWAREIRDQCLARDIPFFFKQWGGLNRKEGGRVLDGCTWDEMARSCPPTRWTRRS